MSTENSTLTDESNAKRSLSESHRKMLADSGLSEARIIRRGYYTELSPKRLGALNVTRAGAERVPGLVVPLYNVNEKVWGHQYRPDDPREVRGRVVKYETPSGQRNGLDVPPGIGAKVLNSEVPLWITEGSKKADAGVDAGLCVVSMTGVWNWTAPKKSKDEPHRLMETLREVPLDGRQVVLAFDGDVARKPQVHQACEALAQKLTDRGATVAYLHLPDTDDKTGLDDYLAAGHTAEDLQTLVKPTLPSGKSAAAALNPCPVVYDGPPQDGAELLNAVRDWFQRFIGVVNNDDHAVLALWAVHTHLTFELWTTPRMMLDSAVPGSGKSTVLEHLNYLARNTLYCAISPSRALVPRVLDRGPATLLLDEVHKTLHPDGPGTRELLGVLDSGYKRGAKAPTLVPGPDGAWDVGYFPCFAPVAFAGNHPDLPDDTVSRAIHILLMPSLPDEVDDTDWYRIESEIHQLAARIIAWADQVRGSVNLDDTSLPKNCRGRNRERWRPLAWVAAAAGGDWPNLVYELVEKDLERQQAEREAGSAVGITPEITLLTHLRRIWPNSAKDTPAKFVKTEDLRRLLVKHDRYWTENSKFGRELTVQRFGQLVHKVTGHVSKRENPPHGPRGYFRAQFGPAWERLGIPEGDDGDEGDDG